MSQVGKIQKHTNNRFLNHYEFEAIHRDGSISPYYVASRAKDIAELKAVTHRNDPDGVILYGVYGENKDQVVLIRQYRYPVDMCTNSPPDWENRAKICSLPPPGKCTKKPALPSLPRKAAAIPGLSLPPLV